VRNWFRTQPVGVAAPDTVEAYREGRVDERRRLEPATATRASRAEIQAAYDRGRARRRSASPLVSLVMLIAVVVAGAFIYLAVRNGSFSNGGAVVDNSLDKVAQTVDAPLKNAAENTGAALQKAGQKLK